MELSTFRRDTETYIEEEEDAGGLDLATTYSRISDVGIRC
jgi:hypothetical protein